MNVYQAVPATSNGSGIVYKVGPRGGKYFIACYADFLTARHVADMLNTHREAELHG